MSAIILILIKNEIRVCWARDQEGYGKQINE